MSYVPSARLIAVALVFRAIPVAAEQIDLDLNDALERAHRVAPDAIAARGRIIEAQALSFGADLPFTINPEIDVGVGPRLTSERPFDIEARIDQDLEPWRRGPRRKLALAEVGRAHLEADATLRQLDLEVSSAFCQAMFSERSAELARRGEELAQRGVTVAERRRRAGDITDLDANLARAALGRARSAVQAAASQRAGAVGRLAALIGAKPDDAIALHGELKLVAVPPPDAGRATPAARPDVRVLDAVRDVAVAERAQAIAHGRPALALWASYRREDTTSIVLGGLRMTLPLWNRSPGEIAAARAKERAAIETREVTLLAAERQVADALAVYEHAQQSVAVFEHDVVPLLDESERLLQSTLDAGQIAVSDYLVARQELLNGRREHLDRLLALALAAIELRHVGGGPR
jgi:outer membrane protein TolC